MTMETTPTTAADGRGALIKGAAIGLATILGGHAVMWSILPGLQSMAAALAFLIAPWIALIALVVHFLRKREGAPPVDWASQPRSSSASCCSHSASSW